MPIYEYKCKDHGVFEQRHSMASFPRVTECPTCDGPAPKIISAVNVGRVSGVTSAQSQAMDLAQASSSEPTVVNSTRGQLPSTVSASKPANITQNPQHRFLPAP